jgi:hypothetical protein
MGPHQLNGEIAMIAKLSNVTQGHADVLLDGRRIGFVEESRSGWWYGWLTINGQDHRIDEWHNAGRSHAVRALVKAHEEQMRIHRACANQC